MVVTRWGGKGPSTLPASLSASQLSSFAMHVTSPRLARARTANSCGGAPEMSWVLQSHSQCREQGGRTTGSCRQQIPSWVARCNPVKAKGSYQDNFNSRGQAHKGCKGYIILKMCQDWWILRQIEEFDRATVNRRRSNSVERYQLGCNQRCFLI